MPESVERNVPEYSIERLPYAFELPEGTVPAYVTVTRYRVLATHKTPHGTASQEAGSYSSLKTATLVASTLRQAAKASWL